MKLVTFGLATALAFTSTCALAQSTGGKFGGGWRGNKRHDDRIFHQWNDSRWNDIRQCDGRRRRHRRVQQRRQRRGRAEQHSEPVGEHASQSLAQRFDIDAGSTRLADRQMIKSPALRGFLLA